MKDSIDELINFINKEFSRLREKTFKKKTPDGHTANEWADCLSFNDDVQPIQRAINIMLNNVGNSDNNALKRDTSVYSGNAVSARFKLGQEVWYWSATEGKSTLNNVSTIIINDGGVSYRVYNSAIVYGEDKLFASQQEAWARKHNET